ncbi:tail fiber protein [Acinetobacter phage Ab69]|nr:tail fiber protein [Acinetobacter phage Ab69]
MSLPRLEKSFIRRSLHRNLSNNNNRQTNSKRHEANGAVIEGTEQTQQIPFNIRVKELVAYKYGMISSNIAYRNGIQHKLSKDVFIDKITIEEHGNFVMAADTARTLGNIYLHIQVNDPTYTLHY